MTSFPELLRQGTASAWLFAPSAILLGALHGLEPGHSKTMMAAFIVAIRGTVRQAVLLGLAATLSHTAVVWAVALIGLHLAGRVDAAASEPWFQLASGVAIIAIALWMLFRTHREQAGAASHHHGHDHGHDHSHGHGYDEGHDEGYGDAHQREHAAQIERRFVGRPVTTGQLVLFGLTGGLVPCPASITILLLCLQLRQLSLGIALVLCFSIGLALTMVASGTLAALSLRQVGKHFGGFGGWARKAPYFSGLVVIAVGLYTAQMALVSLGWAG